MRAIALALLLAFPALARAGDEWTTADTIRQGIFTGLIVIDWAQTNWIIEHPSSYYETNRILGDHPSKAQNNLYAATAIVGHAAISYMLPRGWREGWQYVWIGVEVDAVTSNRGAGIKVSFPF